GLAAAPSIVDHHDKILHVINDFLFDRGVDLEPTRIIYENQKKCQAERDAKQGACPASRAGGLYLALRRPVFVRIRSICARGSVRQISPIHSSFTPLIGLALKLLRLTRFGDFERSIVFR